MSTTGVPLHWLFERGASACSYRSANAVIACAGNRTLDCDFKNTLAEQQIDPRTILGAAPHPQEPPTSAGAAWAGGAGTRLIQGSTNLPNARFGASPTHSRAVACSISAACAQARADFTSGLRRDFDPSRHFVIVTLTFWEPSADGGRCQSRRSISDAKFKRFPQHSPVFCTFQTQGGHGNRAS